MKTRTTKKVRCAIYTRVSTDQGLEQDFNSLDAQYDASQAYIRSQVHAGAGRSSGPNMTMADSLAATPIAQRCSGCWTMSAPERSMSSFCTRSTA